MGEKNKTKKSKIDRHIINGILRQNLVSFIDESEFTFKDISELTNKNLSEFNLNC